MQFLSVALALLIAAAAEPPEPFARVVDMEPSIAPDGAAAFVSNRFGAFEIYIMTPDGRLRRATSDGAPKDTPAWSPDGRRIAYVAESGGETDIFLIDVAGGEPTRLTSGPQSDLHPHWSPDGGTIVFTRYFPAAEGKPDRLRLQTINADGSDLRRLTSGPSASYASYSPDGGSLVYWKFFGDNADIVVADRNARRERRLTNDAAFEGWPCWAPDGGSIAFAREKGEDADIFVFELETGEQRQVTFGPGRKTSPKWSADGKAIYFQGTVGGASGLWKVGAGE